MPEPSTSKLETKIRVRQYDCCHGFKVFLWGAAVLLILVTAYILIQMNISNVDSTKPEQIHLSLGTNETEMVVTWSTLTKLRGNSSARFGTDKSRLDRYSGPAEVNKFLPSLFMYRALMVGLKPDTVYYYQVGSNGTTWSTMYNFRTLKSGPDWFPRMAIYGDFGLQNKQSLPFLSKDVKKGLYDVIFHVGDIAYDLHERDGQQGNDFMNAIEPVAARVPYMTCPGNHERYQNFSHYDARFTMIGDRHKPDHMASLTSRLNNHFYSVDIGPAHFLLFSTEFYYYTEFGWEQIERQFRFLEEDLRRANANRAKRPWIIAMSHKPFYRTNEKDIFNQTSLDRAVIRSGITGYPGKLNETVQYGLEKFFFENGVDLQVTGHEHSYARLVPIYDFKMLQDKCDRQVNHFHNPKGPIHVVTGSAGCRVPSVVLNPEQSEWIAHRSMDYGYTRLSFKSANHLILEQLSDTQNGTVIDKMEITKDRGRPQWTIPK